MERVGLHQDQREAELVFALRLGGSQPRLVRVKSYAVQR
jgi:hypothetical protein